ncbi:glycosyltransferase family 4 protein [Vibrio sp. JZG10]
MKKSKALFILHTSPPIHGASVVGDIIVSSDAINSKFEPKFIKLESSETIEDIGKVNFRKLMVFMKLLFKVTLCVFSFKPSVIYFTASPNGVAFYRDLVLMLFLKVYQTMNSCKIYLHYHTRGISSNNSFFFRRCSRFFLSNTIPIVLAEELKEEFKGLIDLNSLKVLNNGVADQYCFSGDSFPKNGNKVQLLYLSNLMKDKGYREILGSIDILKDKYEIGITFAGSWGSQEDEKYFKDFVESKSLENYVTYAGIVKGESKKALLNNSDFVLLPTRYSKEAFPLVLLESLSCGIPVLSSNVGGIPSIVDPDVGLILATVDIPNIVKGIERLIQDYSTREARELARCTYMNKYSLKAFESNLIGILYDK